MKLSMLDNGIGVLAEYDTLRDTLLDISLSRNIHSLFDKGSAQRLN